MTNRVDGIGTATYTYDGVGQLLSEAGPWSGVSVSNTYSSRLRQGMIWVEVGVHGNGGYYQIDVTGIVDAYGHGLVFTEADIDQRIDTAKASWVGTNPGSLGLGMGEP